METVEVEERKQFEKEIQVESWKLNIWRNILSLKM